MEGRGAGMEKNIILDSHFCLKYELFIQSNFMLRMILQALSLNTIPHAPFSVALCCTLTGIETVSRAPSILVL